MKHLESLHPAAPLDAVRRSLRTGRSRWRLRAAVTGLAIAGGVALILILSATLGLDLLRFAPGALTGFRIAVYLLLLAAAAWFVARPLLRSLPDERVALYLEEREATLDGHLVSAVACARAPAGLSPALAGRLVASAARRCADVEYGRRVERDALRRAWGGLAGVGAFGVLLFLAGPGFVREGTPLLLTPWADRAAPYAIEVSPGNVVVPKRSDLSVEARLRGFEAERVELAARRGADGGETWRRWAMVPGDSAGRFDLVLFDLQDATEYYVEAGGVRSPVFRAEVRDLPYTRRLVHEYRFPAYTGLSPRTVEDAGDIAALRDTRVTITVHATRAVAEGAIVVGGRDTLRLEAAGDSALRGVLTVSAPTSYRVLLAAPGGTLAPGSADYWVDVLPDLPPAVTIARPGRDLQVTSVEEVFVDAAAEDDYGITRLELVYSVNGGPEQVRRLDAGGSRRSVQGGHTFYLEELGLEPGDLIAYHARARDARPGGSPATSDIYFLTVRPFDRSYRQADQAGQGGGGGEPSIGNGLSGPQREIIAATFNVIRDRATKGEAEIREDLATIALSQGKLREQVETLVQRMTSRGVVGMDSMFQAIAEALPEAARAMREAERELGRRRADSALPPEQRALQQLQRAEAAFREIEVQRGGGGGGGAPGDQGRIDELADLFEIELDRMQNQYETLQRGRQEAADRAVDETLEKLRELARRQQQQVERARARERGAEAAGGGGGGGGGQRGLAEEAEEAARRLERLSREESRPDLARAAQRLREAAEAMRRPGSGGGGSAEGRAALEELRQATRMLERGQAGRFGRALEDARRRAGGLRDRQEEVARDVAQLDGGADRADRTRRLQERKTQMAGELEELQRDLDRLAREAGREQAEAGRRIGEAVSDARRRQLGERILFSRGVIVGGGSEYARNFEEQIGVGLRGLAARLDSAAAAVQETTPRQAEALDRTREAVQDLESLADRAAAAAAAGRASGAPRDGNPEARANATPEAGRQWRRELQERRRDLDEIRRSLRAEGVETAELERILSAIDRLGQVQGGGDLREAEALAREVVQRLKEFEFALRRRADPGADRILLTGDETVPPEYRALVEEYFRALAGGASRR